MTFDPMFITTNFFVQAQRAAELMAEQDAKMDKIIEDMRAAGYSVCRDRDSIYFNLS